MIKPNLLEDISNIFKNSIPKETIKKIVTTAVEKMDLVSREEFDIQSKVLIKTRKKLESLESKVLELEKNN